MEVQYSSSTPLMTTSHNTRWFLHSVIRQMVSRNFLYTVLPYLDHWRRRSDSKLLERDAMICNKGPSLESDQAEISILLVDQGTPDKQFFVDLSGQQI